MPFLDKIFVLKNRFKNLFFWGEFWRFMFFCAKNKQICLVKTQEYSRISSFEANYRRKFSFAGVESSTLACLCAFCINRKIGLNFLFFYKI